ncbi:mevalonate kinase family protein [Amphritea sp. HPY]|uniref:mevalonate kinase family protein n=1 Tax=Amphritea sp. HPY TaxID=3421652 RepID=UPI003D7C6541
MIDLTPLKVTAPGSLMLMGEHSVLFGEPALACAVDKRISVELTPRDDRQVVIDSALAGYRSDLDHLAAEAKLSFVLVAIQRQQAVLPAGFELRIRSEFSHTVGLGSSAAVTVAVVTALMAFSGASGDPMAVFNESLAVVHQVQDGRGSGTDLVAAVFGGVVSYTVATAESPAQIRALKGLPKISLYYAGYKTKTPDVLKIVEQYCAQQPQLYAGIYRLMGQCTAQAELAVERSDWVSLGQLMNMYQGFMDALGVNDKQLVDIIYSLRQSDAIYAAKISGSGLGDCVLALGQDANLSIAYEQIPVSISAQGVSVEYQ